MQHDALNDYRIKKVGQHRGAPRLWLEGQSIAKAGFGPGVAYDIEVGERAVTLKACKNGARTVVAKKKGDGVNPVIDINSAELLALFDGMDAVRMIVRNGEVVFSPMASEIRKRERLDRIRQKMVDGAALDVGSAFHGGGVLSAAVHEGFERAGVPTRTAFVNEIREDLLDHAMDVHPAIDADTLTIASPAQELVQDQWMMHKLPKVDILEMGIPCSGASVAGRAKRGLEKPEDHPEVGHLVFSALMILNKTQPAVVLIENVKQYAATASASLLRLQMRDMGYDVHEAVLNGKDFGCLEARERWCMIGVTRGLEFSFDQLVPKPFEVKPLGAYLEQIGEDDPRWSEMAGLKAKEVRDKAAGKGFMMQTFGPEDVSIATITKGYAKVRSTDPKIKHPSNPDLLRQLTPVEHARIKQVPERLIEGLSATLAHELLGQGIAYEPFAQLSELLGETAKRAAGAKLGAGTSRRASGMKVG